MPAHDYFLISDVDNIDLERSIPSCWFERREGVSKLARNGAQVWVRSGNVFQACLDGFDQAKLCSAGYRMIARRLSKKIILENRFSFV